MPATTDPTAAYAALRRLTAEQLDAARRGDFEVLDALHAAWTRTASRLPAVPPPDAAPLLRELSDQSAELGRVLADARRRLDGDRDRVDTGRRTAQAYRETVETPGATRTDRRA